MSLFSTIWVVPLNRSSYNHTLGSRVKHLFRHRSQGAIYLGETLVGTRIAQRRAAYSTQSARSQSDQGSDMAHKAAKKEPAIPRPSSSAILVSPTNEILLLHRVRTSTSFASAHVFPGGNISSSQDGECPPPEDPSRHDDAIHYRRAAIRELFEESGILLAKDRSTGQMVHVTEAERERGRHAIHRNEITFQKWLQGQNAAAEPDTDALIPFTHWITPANLPKRFSTQMYLYFLPVPEESDQLAQDIPAGGMREEIQVPTSDGGVEIMEARFLPACDWLQKARSGEIILYPPQLLLLNLVSQFLDQEPRQGASSTQLKERRSELLDFIHSGNPPWTDKYISPKMMKMLPDNRVVLALDSPGPELRGSVKRGEMDRVILVRHSKEGPRDVEIRWKTDILRADSKSSL